MPIRHIITDGYVPGGQGDHLIPTGGYGAATAAVAQAHDPGALYESDDPGAAYVAHDPGADYAATA